jgi:hypothetical protein
MGAIELRNKIIQLLETDNISYLKDIFEYAEKQKSKVSDTTTVGYTVQGKALTKNEYVKHIKQAEDQIEKGEYSTVEDLEREAENW